MAARSVSSSTTRSAIRERGESASNKASSARSSGCRFRNSTAGALAWLMASAASKRTLRPSRVSAPRRSSESTAVPAGSTSAPRCAAALRSRIRSRPQHARWAGTRATSNAARIEAGLESGAIRRHGVGAEQLQGFAFHARQPVELASALDRAAELVGLERLDDVFEGAVLLGLVVYEYNSAWAPRRRQQFRRHARNLTQPFAAGSPRLNFEARSSGPNVTCGR